MTDHPHQRGTYSLLSHDVWNDVAVRELPDNAFRLFLWSFTNSTGASLTGLTSASRMMIRRALAWSDDTLTDALRGLAEKPLVLYDEESETMLCVNRGAYSMRSERTVKQALRIVRNMPSSPLVAQWRAQYRDAIGDAA